MNADRSSTERNAVRRVWAAAALGLAALFTAGTARAADYPPGFYEEPVIALRRQSTTVIPVRRDAFLIAEKPGTVVVAVGGRLRAELLSIPVNNDLERGLLGLALEPGFARRGYLYVYYTAPGPTPRNRVSRFFIDGRNDVGPEEVLLSGIPSDSGLHNGGCLRFGPDGNLYIGVGDGGSNPAGAMDLSSLAGKILRIEPNGAIPADNPFASTPGARPEIYAFGLRNPYRFSFDPASPGRLFANDVGNQTWEEVNEIKSGVSYGWPLNEGPGAPCCCSDPIAYYPNAGGAAVTGSAFYRGAEYPPDLFGNYFYADFVTGRLRRLVLGNDGDVLASETFATGLASPIDLVCAPDGDLYYLSYNSKTVYRIRYVGAENRPPALSLSATPEAGRAPLEVAFKMNGSYDPDGDPLTFHLDFADGASVETASLGVTHLFTEPRDHDVVVTARDGHGGEASAMIRIVAGNAYPSPVITTPADRTTYACGDEITYEGLATDFEDGALPASALTWTISFLHDTHGHPFIGPLEGVAGGGFTIPRTGEVATNVAYKIQLRATDSGGLSAKAKVVLLPRLTSFYVLTSPLPFTVEVAGAPQAAPASVESVVGYEWLVSVPTPQIGTDGQLYDFDQWADSGLTDNPRLYRAPAEPEDIVAIFLRRP